MANYLNTGRSLYVEGADLGYNSQNPIIFPYLGTNWDGDGAATNNVSSLTGQTGTFADGILCDYPPHGVAEGPDSYVDEFSGTGNGVVVFECQNNKGRVVANYDTTANGEYCTIASSVMFSYLVEDKAFDGLMAEYIDFLDNNTPSGIESTSLGTIKSTFR